jgi:hypothetical protein
MVKPVTVFLSLLLGAPSVYGQAPHDPGARHERFIQCSRTEASAERPRAEAFARVAACTGAKPLSPERLRRCNRRVTEADLRGEARKTALAACLRSDS